MRLTFLTPTLEVAGGTLVLRAYIEAALQAGHHVTIVSPDRGTWKQEGVTVRTYPPVRFRYSDTLTFQAPYWKKIATMIPEDTDILLPIYTPLVVPAIRFQKKHPHTKIVLIAQESMEVLIIGTYNKWLLQKKSVTERLSHVITVSLPLKEQLAAILPPSLPLTLIPNGIDHTIFKPKATTKKEEILFVGRPDVTKGFPTYLKVLEALHTQYPTLRGRVVAPGRYAVDHPLVRFTPDQTLEEIATAYREARVYLNSSQAESFALPVLEAMACGTPVVLTNTLGPRQFAVHEENALIAPVGDVAALTAAVERLLEDQTLTQKLSIAGIKTAAAYDWQQSGRQFARTLASLA